MRRSKIKRCGFTLVEMAVTLVAVTAVLAATAVLVAFILHLGADVSNQTHTVAVTERLAEQFRADMHSAVGEPSIAADHRAAEFHLARGRVIKWRIDDRDGIVRTEHASHEADRENAYPLPQDATAAFDSQAKGINHTIALRIDSPGSSGPSLLIAALAGRDERLAAEVKR